MLLHIFYYLPAVLGVLFIAIGVRHGWKLRALTRRCKIPAKGELLGFQEKKLKSGSLYYPVVRFQSEDGQTHEARYEVGDAEWEMQAGDEVDLRYNPDHPEEIYLDHIQSWWREYASPFFIIIGGLIFIGTYYFVL